MPSAPQPAPEPGVRLVAGALLVALAACGNTPVADDSPDADIDAPGRACTELLGDRSRPIEARPVYVDYRGQLQPIAGGNVGLIPPIQGGYVLMVGLEATNLNGCSATVKGVLRDLATGAVVAEEERPSQLFAGADGWGAPSFPQTATTANLTTCPPFTGPPPHDIDGTTWRLELSITETGGRAATWSGDVVPMCRASEPDPTACPCQCDADFEFGQPCPID